MPLMDQRSVQNTATHHDANSALIAFARLLGRQAANELAEAEQAEAEALLKGRVPQLQDWIDAWASASSTTSYRKEDRVRRKRSQGRTSSNIRTRRRKQVRVIAEVIRDQHSQAVA